ncbi:S1C family serine protease [Pengzhenrongella frigida]|uniref:PDZ domain-containing protein n=1 Tax=Pengzhenrongella frigida TaxID=1259133 RepID=A0A4Q5N1N1_9MICO|nr:trypsin-like peptidase domain-containing protein [Cellulomonas sp. HLT2-17]RYV52000.1 PDZ domain-containing protein [Cellulomonas sp. HLT2-17]
MTTPDQPAVPADQPDQRPDSRPSDNPFAPPSTSRYASTPATSSPGPFASATAPIAMSAPASAHRHAVSGPPPALAPAGAGTGTWGAPPPPWAVSGDPLAAPGPTDRPGRRRRPRRALSAVWIGPLLVLALGAGALGGVAADRVLGDGRLADAGLPVTVLSGGATRPPDSIAGLAARVLPSVVSIQVDSSQGTSTGSGLVLRQDGYLLTNNHVVAAGAESGARIVVLFADGTEEEATIVGRTGDYDLAVVKVERTGLVPLVLGDSDEVAVGDPVVAVGAPLGLEGTVTTGIISALNRPVSAGDATDIAFINALQTDAAINPGNSGGPLVNGAGEVIGINSAIAQPPGAGTTAAGSIGLGFAIPSNQARRTAEQLIETGQATYPVVGVLLDQGYGGEGVQVATEPQQGQEAVSSGGPADKAGIRSGDIILSIDGRPVTEPDELIVAIRAKAPGETVSLRVRTGDEPEREVRVVLDEATSE